jgi:hypothetical protein
MISLAALTAFASAGLMQGAEQAAFHLPVAAHWGQSVLAPGDYKMYLPERSGGGMRFLVSGLGKSVFETPLVMGTQNFSSTSYLKLREIDGNYFVREFSSGPAGEIFTFPVPKTPHRRGAEKGVNISLAVAGN